MLTFYLVFENLNTYSIYYEEQLATSEKERRDNVIKVTITNLRSLHHKDIPKMYFFTGGFNLIRNFNSSYTPHYPSIEKTTNGYSYLSNDENRYYFDNKLNLRYGTTPPDYKLLDISQVNEEEIKDKMYETIKPVIDAQKKPKLFNLLWLYKLVRK
ncbi:hypothetical protein IR123_00190 [Streptococcus sp. 19428wC2_LYSM12]|uniref:hypothetical protein n=1 Tax=unclassified Streptococcus TaxID=2608887 RepID=UPI001071A4D4|nr:MULTISPECIES: hypothetical protein [unclassified Streptococcus]MBF0786354.1 hypothetical protein [Streptococcus sp. 19428wC2_LYSM12]MCQ9213801.1 hypothetical protein [Streptococcus sp. O1]TFV06764.1 hypothetical protein E4T79_00190 [Streptococcus sp. LYSM12]